MRRSHLLASIVAFATLVVARQAAAACSVSPSPTTPCFNHNGAVFTVDVGSGAKNNPPLDVTPNVQLTFQIDSTCAACSFHPLYVSTSSLGGGAGFVTGGITSGSFTFTPTANQLQSGLYYQCQIHGAMGAQIVDVTFDGGVADAGGEGGVTDAGTTDASADASVTDASVTDAGVKDASEADTGPFDDGSIPTDATTTSDAAKPDAGVTPQTDDTGGCSVVVAGGAAAPWGAALVLGVAVAAVARRRRRR
jgi:MYXO-CTERM domain-containing protein